MFPLHLLHRCIFAKNLDFRLQFDALLPIDDTLDVRHQGKEIFGSAAAVDKETGVLFAHLCAADGETLQPALVDQLRRKSAWILAVSTVKSKGLAIKSSAPKFMAMMTFMLSPAEDKNRMGALVCFRSSRHQ